MFDYNISPIGGDPKTTTRRPQVVQCASAQPRATAATTTLSVRGPVKHHHHPGSMRSMMTPTLFYRCIAPTGLSLAEAMLRGMPVIAANWSGNADFVTAADHLSAGAGARSRKRPRSISIRFGRMPTSRTQRTPCERCVTIKHFTECGDSTSKIAVQRCWHPHQASSQDLHASCGSAYSWATRSRRTAFGYFGTASPARTGDL
jgi:hypothetical protein